MLDKCKILHYNKKAIGQMIALNAFAGEIMKITIDIKPTICKDKMKGVAYELDGKLYSHEELSKELFNIGLSVLVKEACNYGYYTDNNGKPRYDI